MARAQIIPDLSGSLPAGDTISSKEAIALSKQRDLIDLGYLLFHKNPRSRLDNSGTKNTRLYFTVAPVVEFTIATGFSPGVAGNVAFLTSAVEKTNTSTFLGAVKYTQKNQFLLPVQSSVWTPGNKFNLQGDWRYFKYPQDTYGFGGFTQLSDKYIVDYEYLRFYESIRRKIGENLYAGLGYQLDLHWKIRELGVPPGKVTDFQKYGYSGSSASSGIALDFVFDTRENSINVKGGSFFANLHLVQNARFLGASSNYNTITLDLRGYFKMPFHTILALWSYSVFTVSGNPPYLDLTGTGTDPFNNTGRGYEQGRFIGKHMIDLEAEIRFNITRDGLLGAVVFGNAETVSELGSNRLEVISPAIGVGLRIKFNKFSGTNACLDYGVGKGGSRGFVGNLGEVF